MDEAIAGFGDDYADLCEDYDDLDYFMDDMHVPWTPFSTPQTMDPLPNVTFQGSSGPNHARFDDAALAASRAAAPTRDFLRSFKPFEIETRKEMEEYFSTTMPVQMVEYLDICSASDKFKETYVSDTIPPDVFSTTRKAPEELNWLQNNWGKECHALVKKSVKSYLCLWEQKASRPKPVRKRRWQKHDVGESQEGKVAPKLKDPSFVATMLVIGCLPWPQLKELCHELSILLVEPSTDVPPTFLVLGHYQDLPLHLTTAECVILMTPLHFPKGRLVSVCDKAFRRHCQWLTDDDKSYYTTSLNPNFVKQLRRTNQRSETWYTESLFPYKKCMVAKSGKRRFLIPNDFSMALSVHCSMPMLPAVVGGLAARSKLTSEVNKMTVRVLGEIPNSFPSSGFISRRVEDVVCHFYISVNLRSAYLRVVAPGLTYSSQVVSDSTMENYEVRGFAVWRNQRLVNPMPYTSNSTHVMPKPMSWDLDFSNALRQLGAFEYIPLRPMFDFRFFPPGSDALPAVPATETPRWVFPTHSSNMLPLLDDGDPLQILYPPIVRDGFSGFECPLTVVPQFGTQAWTHLTNQVHGIGEVGD